MAVVGQYTAEKMAALRASMRSVPQSNVVLDAKVVDVDDDMVLAEDESEATLADEQTVTSPGGRTLIPTAEDIQLARHRREMARQRDDFIPLDASTGRTPASSSNGGKRQSALRCGELSDDEDDVTPTLSFGDAARLTNRQSAQRQIKQALHSGQGHDAAFEQQQLDMALGRDAARSVAAKTQPAVSTTGLAAHANETRQFLRRPLPVVSTPASSLDQVEVLVRKLKDTLASMNEVHGSHVNHLHRLTEDLEVSTTAVPKLQQQTQEASQRYMFFQELRAYVSSLLSCLDEKVPAILQAEADMHQLVAGRKHTAAERRRHALIDDMEAIAEAVDGGRVSCSQA